MAREKDKTDIFSRVDMELDKKLTRMSEKSGKSKSMVIRNIIEDYFKISKTKNIKDLKTQLENITPDFKVQATMFNTLVEQVKEYSETNNKLHKYIAEQKSAESYYFRELKEQMDNVEDRCAGLENTFSEWLKKMEDAQEPTYSENDISTQKQVHDKLQKFDSKPPSGKVSSHTGFILDDNEGAIGKMPDGEFYFVLNGERRPQKSLKGDDFVLYMRERKKLKEQKKWKY